MHKIGSLNAPDIPVAQTVPDMPQHIVLLPSEQELKLKLSQGFLYPKPIYLEYVKFSKRLVNEMLNSRNETHLFTTAPPKMKNSDTDNHCIQIRRCEEISDHTFQELPTQLQSMTTAYAQQSHVSPLKFPQVTLQTHITPCDGTTYFMPSRAPLYEQAQQTQPNT